MKNSNEDTNVLLRTNEPEDNTFVNNAHTQKVNQFEITKTKLNEICAGLTRETQKYDPNETIKAIESYICVSGKLDRMLYSEISSYMFSLEDEDRGIYTTNLDKLMSTTLNQNHEANEECQKIILKIYDHSQLALRQIENTNNIFANSIDEARENLERQMKGIEKEYITILGIFASVILAFVGGMTFSTSVLQNMANVSIYRLVLTIDFLAFIFINAIYVLMEFIFTINGKNDGNTKQPFEVKRVNKVCLVIGIITVIAWLFDLEQFQSVFSSILTWG